MTMKSPDGADRGEVDRMNEEKDKTVILLQGSMLALNVAAVILISTFIYYTTEKIIYRYDARSFLDGVTAIPKNPENVMHTCIIAAVFLVVSSLFRQIVKKYQLMICSMLFDLVLCFMVIYTLNFNYNGLLLFLFATMISLVKGGKVKVALVALAIGGYVLADYELLSIYMPLYHLNSYIQYYPASTQQIFYGVFNILISLNVVLFIIYCVYVINAQRGTIEQINELYHEIQTANEQLQEYASMTEKMTQTKERNRLAREIHDTLGHTLTGIATGLDACLALIDISPEQTKKQLKLLSDVSREGIKDVRRSVNELRPDALERLSLDAAIRKMIIDMSQASDVKIYFSTEEKHLKFDEDEENAIYRVIQESITNAVRHGKAGKIWITLKRQNDVILLSIKDNGIGAKEIKSGFGTKHIKERIEMLHGTVSFDGSDGFTVTAEIPIRWGENYD